MNKKHNKSVSIFHLTLINSKSILFDLMDIIVDEGWCLNLLDKV